MTREQCDEICKERLDGWRETLVGDHATPALMIGIGHDHASGRISVSVPNNFSNAEICVLLEGVLRRLKKNRSR